MRERQIGRSRTTAPVFIMKRDTVNDDDRPLMPLGSPGALSLGATHRRRHVPYIPID
jgi:hypothetical protein